MTFSDKMLHMQRKVNHAFDTYQFPRKMNKLAIMDLLFTRPQTELDRFLACPDILLERHIYRCWDRVLIEKAEPRRFRGAEYWDPLDSGAEDDDEEDDAMGEPDFG
jgi:hypothetical protein